MRLVANSCEGGAEMPHKMSHVDANINVYILGADDHKVTLDIVLCLINTEILNFNI